MEKNAPLPECPETPRARQMLTLQPDPFNWRKVFCVAKHDLFGTKDVQDAITASYVWLADQLGHFTLGFLPTLLGGWIWTELWKQMPASFHLPATGVPVGIMIIGVLVWTYWLRKERQDYADSKKNAHHVTPHGDRHHFPFDEFDLVWNVVTALLYFGTGGVFAVSALLAEPTGKLLGISTLTGGILNLALTLVVILVPDALVVLWWLRRKMAFQQADLPYLYRLANFPNAFRPPELYSLLLMTSAPDEIGQHNQMDNLLIVQWIRRQIKKADDPAAVMKDLGRQGIPHYRHLIITGPLKSGKSSLSIGIGTEYAFVKGIGRYMSFTKLLQLLEQTADRVSREETFEFDSGRVLWPLRKAGLLIVDDVDAGLSGSGAKSLRPERLGKILNEVAGNRTSLHWLKNRRSVWVLGKTSTIADLAKWKKALSEAIGVSPGEMGIIRLS